MLDIEKIREETPACNDILHFNNAGASLAPVEVSNALIGHLKREQEIGAYEAALEATDGIENFYTSFAGLLNCRDEEIACMENSTAAWNMAIASINFQAGDEIITGDMEYASNYLGLLHLQKSTQIKIRLIPSDSDGLIDLLQLRSNISSRTRMIALTHIPSQRGDVQPATEVGKIARENNLFYLLDACQSIGQRTLDVQQLNCDFLCGSGRKYLRGPRGTGFLYVNKKRLSELNPASIDLHSAAWESADTYRLRDDARRFENWESYVAGKIALGVAVDYASNLGMDAIQARIEHLGKMLRNSLTAIKGVSVHERSDQPSGIVTFNKQSIAAVDLQQRLREMKINSSVSAEKNSRLDLAKHGNGDVNRASIHYYNLESEISRFVEAVDKL